MHAPSTKSGLFFCGRVLAILSLTVLFVGKTVHLHQECGCCTEQCDVSANKPQPVRCPFGCEHHQHAEGESSDSSEPKHDEHHCPICSLLAQPPESISLPEIKESPGLTAQTILLLSDRRVERELRVASSRGPPDVA